MSRKSRKSESLKRFVDISSAQQINQFSSKMSHSHTWRRNPFVASNRMRFSAVSREVTKHEDGSMEVPVSSADMLLEDTDTFILNHPMYLNYYNSIGLHGGNLNKHSMWNVVIDELEASCISKTERQNRRYGSERAIVYQVPIIGSKLFSAPEIDDDYLGAYHEQLYSQDEFGGQQKLSKTMLRGLKVNPSQVRF